MKFYKKTLNKLKNVCDEYDIIKNSDFYDYIYKFDINGKINKYDKNIVLDKSSHNESFISYFNMEDYLNDIYKSYKKSDEQINIQFEKDYSRENIKINGYRHEEFEIFLNRLDNFSYINENSNILDLTWKKLLILLCCQSSFYLPYQILTNIYKFNHDDFALISDNKINGININIEIDDSKISVKLNNSLIVKNISENTNICNIDATITINFEDVNIKKCANIMEPSICVFNWKIKYL